LQKAGANVLGMGFIIEKSFQKGGQLLRKVEGVQIESLARVSKLANETIAFEID